MHNSRIIVTVNPASWEGDFRLWEAMATGALIFVDPLFVPHQWPLLDGKHVIYYSNQNKTDLWTKLDYYRAHPDIARKIAINGYLHAMTYHRTVSLVDYVLRTAHLKRATYNTGVPIPKYQYSGQYLRFEAYRQEPEIISRHVPGTYPKIRFMANHTHIMDEFA